MMLVTLAWSSLVLTGCGGGGIHHAAQIGDVEKVKALLKDTPDLVLSTNYTGFTPLHCAAEKGHKDVAELLLANGAEVNAKADEGQTPLHLAVLSGHKHVVELLRQHGGHE